MDRFDICVVGGGPAGLTSASILAAAKLRVVVTGYEPGGTSHANLGETVNSTVLESLRELNLVDEFVDLGLPEIAGFQSTWGSSDRQWRDGLMSRQGAGWIFNREKFERMLGHDAQDHGAMLHRGKAIRIRQHFGRWRVWIDGEGAEPLLESDFLVYAIGKRGTSATPRRRLVVDKLIGCTAYIQESGRVWDRTVRVDSVEDGWLYSVQPVPGIRVLIMFTDGDLLNARSAAERLQRVSRAVANAPSLSEVVSPDLLRTMRVGAVSWAATQYRIAACGERWVGCGDMVQSYDPLSSLGIASAMQDGVVAAKALISLVGGDSTALFRRELDRRDMFIDYLRTRYAYYQSESRWADAPFWRRRHCKDLGGGLDELRQRIRGPKRQLRSEDTQHVL